MFCKRDETVSKFIETHYDCLLPSMCGNITFYVALYSCHNLISCGATNLSVTLLPVMLIMPEYNLNLHGLYLPNVLYCKGFNYS